MRATRNRVYRQRYQGFESLRLRQKFTRRMAGRRDTCMTDIIGRARIRERTILQKSKKRMLLIRVFCDFCYCLSRTGIRLRQELKS